MSDTTPTSPVPEAGLPAAPSTTPVAGATTPPVTTPTAAPVVDTRELDWLRGQYQQQMTQLQEMQASLEEYETAALSDDELATHQLTKQQQDLAGQQQRLAETMYAQDLYYYYQGFVPSAIVQGQTPSDWQDAVLRHLKGENDRLTAEVQRLTVAVRPGATPPTVTAPQGKPGRKSVWEMTQSERDAFAERVMSGQASADDYPTV